MRRRCAAGNAFIGTWTERWSWVFLPNIRGFQRDDARGNDGEPDEVKASIRPADAPRQHARAWRAALDCVVLQPALQRIDRRVWQQCIIVAVLIER